MGIASCIASTIVFWYYNIIMAWAMYYVVASFREVVPWSLCGQWWNTPRCTDLLLRTLNDTAANSSSSFLNVTMAWTNHTSEAQSGKSSDTRKPQYCQQIILCSLPPLPPSCLFLSFFFFVFRFLLLLSLLLCVCVGGGGGIKAAPDCCFLRIARGCNSGGKVYSIL